MSKNSVTSAAAPAGWRFYVGISLFAISLCSPVFIPLVMLTGLSVEAKTTISGLLVFGIPQLITFGAIAVVGKPGFQYIKRKLFGFLKTFGPPETVGKGRYRVGIVMFVLPLVVGWLAPYLSGIVPGNDLFRITIGIGGDLLLLASLLVLGGEFWDKIRALFVHDAKVTFPAATVPGN